MRVAIASILAATVVASGCGGAPPRDEKMARDAVYQTDFTTVWNAVSAEMHERFHDANGIKVEDPQDGVIISSWKAMALSATADESTGTGLGQARTALGGDMLQVRVRIDQGGPPWRVTIQSEGAHRSPDKPNLEPYRHGAGDEPAWVQGRADAIRGAIYDRLKQYAVTSSAPAGQPEAPIAPADGTPPAPTPGQ
jgi:hypothetical protein